MRSPLKCSNLPTTRRTGLALAILATMGLAAPLLKHSAQSVFAGQNDNLGAGVTAQRDGTSSNTPPAAGGARNSVAPIEIDEYFPRPAAAERAFLEALEKPVDAEFQETPLEDCLEKLESQAKIDFLIDKAKLTEEGVSLEQPVTLKLKGRKLESVLNLLLRPVQLTYVYEDEVVRITTTQAAGDTLITRTYPVGDLCPELKKENEPAEHKSISAENAQPQVRIALLQGFGGGGGMGGAGGRGGGAGRPKSRFANLIDAITRTIQPDYWEDLSGPGSVIAVAATNSLVIRQTRAVHKEVLQLLRDLRAAQRLPQAVPPGRVSRD